MRVHVLEYTDTYLKKIHMCVPNIEREKWRCRYHLSRSQRELSGLENGLCIHGGPQRKFWGDIKALMYPREGICSGGACFQKTWPSPNHTQPACLVRLPGAEPR